MSSLREKVQQEFARYKSDGANEFLIDAIQNDVLRLLDEATQQIQDILSKRGFGDNLIDVVLAVVGE